MSNKTRSLEFKGEGFTTLYNSIIRDENLSLRARGLMAWIQSHDPEKFKFSKGSFLKISNKEGREAIQKAKQELIDNGYLEIKCYRQGGKFHYKYIFMKGGEKLTANQKTVHGETEHGETVHEEPVLIRKNKEEITIKEKTIERESENQFDISLIGKDPLSLKKVINYFNSKNNLKIKPSDSILAEKLSKQIHTPEEILNILNQSLDYLKFIDLNKDKMNSYHSGLMTAYRFEASYIFNNFENIEKVYHEIKNQKKDSSNVRNFPKSKTVAELRAEYKKEAF